MANRSSNPIFNSRAAEKLRDPDDLDKYIRVTSPSAWAVVLALVCLLGGLLAWGVFGAVYTNVSSTGTCVDSKVMCFLSADEVAKVDVGDEAVVDGRPLKVSHVASVPCSRDEARRELNSDYLEYSLVKSDWTYKVEFDGDNVQGLEQSIPLTVNITTERVSPLQALFG